MAWWETVIRDSSFHGLSPDFRLCPRPILTLATLPARGPHLCWPGFPFTCPWPPVYHLMSWMTLPSPKEDKSVITYQSDFNCIVCLRVHSDSVNLQGRALRPPGGFGETDSKVVVQPQPDSLSQTTSDLTTPELWGGTLGPP